MVVLKMEPGRSCYWATQTLLGSVRSSRAGVFPPWVCEEHEEIWDMSNLGTFPCSFPSTRKHPSPKTISLW